MQLIEFRNKRYPKFQSEGNAARWAMPFVKELCSGYGYDIGYGKADWKLHNAFGIDDGKICTIDGHEENYREVSAMNLPDADQMLDYIFSSHCLEHLPDWVGVLNYWFTKIRPNGLLFLYLPHPDQEYWKPWNNRKHINILHPEDLNDYFQASSYVFWHKVTGKDLNDSFYAIAHKAPY